MANSKKPRSAAQKAATKRMLAGLKKARSAKGGKKSAKKSAKRTAKRSAKRRGKRPASRLAKTRRLIVRAARRTRKNRGDKAVAVRGTYHGKKLRRGKGIVSRVRRGKGKGTYKRLTMTARLNPAKGWKKIDGKWKNMAKRAEKSANAAAHVASKAKSPKTSGKAAGAGIKALAEGLKATNARLDGVEKRVVGTEHTLKVHGHHLHAVRMRVASLALMSKGSKLIRAFGSGAAAELERKREMQREEAERRKLSARLIPR